MKTICLAVFAGGLALSTVSAVYAQQSDDTVTVPVPANQLRVDLPAAYYKMWPEDYRDLQARYSLSNGQTLAIVARGMNMYAYLDDGVPHKIVSTSRDNYVALDRQLKMEIVPGGESGARGWVTMVVPARTLADGGTVPAQLVRLAMR